MKKIIKVDGLQKNSVVYAEADTMEKAKDIFNDLVTSLEEGYPKDDQPVVRDLTATSYYVEWENGDWASIEIADED